MVHQRFSTNTFPTWELAQPFRMLAHNGEINTLRGNTAWMRAREQIFDSEDVFGEDIDHILPDDHARRQRLGVSLDNAAELLLQAGRSVAPRDDDARAGGLAKRRAHAAVQEGLLRVPLVPGRAVGRPRRAGLHRRQADRRDPRSQRPAPRALAHHEGRPRRAWAPRRACSRSRRAASSAAAASSPGACSWSTSSRAASSRTKRSSSALAAPSPTGAGCARTRSASPTSTTSTPSRRVEALPLLSAAEPVRLHAGRSAAA